MYSIVQRPGKTCDVYCDWKLIGEWRGLIFYPQPDYIGVPIALMRFLLQEGTK